MVIEHERATSEPVVRENINKCSLGVTNRCQLGRSNPIFGKHHQQTAMGLKYSSEQVALADCTRVTRNQRKSQPEGSLKMSGIELEMAQIGPQLYTSCHYSAQWCNSAGPSHTLMLHAAFAAKPTASTRLAPVLSQCICNRVDVVGFASNAACSTSVCEGPVAN